MYSMLLRLASAAAWILVISALSSSGALSCADESELLGALAGNPMISCGTLRRAGRCGGAYALCPASCDACDDNAFDHPHHHQINLTNSFPQVLMQDLSSTPQILSCFYGYANCIGVPDEEVSNLTALRNRGCTVVGQGINTASFTQTQLMCSQDHFSVARTPLPSPMDGMPCVFSFPVDRWSLESVSQIEIELSDGRVINPDCASLTPATELSQLHTLLLLSESFGAKPQQGLNSAYPVAVHVQGVKPLHGTIALDSSKRGPFNLSYTGSMTYENSGVEMIRARLLPADLAVALDSVGVGLVDLRRGASTCQESFQQVTHALQVIFSGGVSKDGVTSVDAGEASQFFIVRLSGQQLTTEVLGLADNTNPDNYYEICLRLSNEQLLLASTTSLEVETPCDVSTNSALYGPKGLCSESNSACSATPCARKRLEVEISLSFSTSSGSTTPGLPADSSTNAKPDKKGKKNKKKSKQRKKGKAKKKGKKRTSKKAKKGNSMKAS